MKKIFLIIAIFFASKTIAQNTNLTNNATYGQRYQEQVENNTAKPNAPLYNGVNSTNSSGGGSNEIFERGYWKKKAANEAKQSAENYRVKQLLENEKRVQEQNELSERVRDNFLRDKELKQKKDLALATMVPIIANDGMNYTEATEAGEMMLYFARNNLTFPEEENKNASKNLYEFRRLANTESFEKLMDLIWMGSRYALSTTDNLNSLKKRFPQKIDTLEKAELNMMANYFGGYRALFYNTTDPYYPKSIFEILSDNDKKVLMKQFDYLAKKFPLKGLLMAGNCRDHLNPYYIEGLTFSKLLNNDDVAIKFEANKKVLFSIHTPILQIGEKPSNDNYEKVKNKIFRRFKDSFQWIERNYPNYVYDLLKEDWKKIADAQGVPLLYIQYVVSEFSYNYSSWTSYYQTLIKAADEEGNDINKNGKTTFKYSNGDIYTGYFKNGARDGVGTYQYINGNTYTGEWENNVRSGKGFYKKANGFYVEGTYKNNIVDNVKYYNASKKEITENEFYKTPLEKNITVKYDYGTYIGDVQNDKRNGKGKLNYTNGAMYEGDFKDDKIEGNGTMAYSGDTTTYTGSWANNLPGGLGTKKWTKKGESYTGEWKEGKRNGKGAYTYKDSSINIGTWVNGVREGDFEFRYVNGDYKTGKIINNKREGLWTYYFKNKNISTTNYIADKKNGEYVVTKTNGTKQKGIYKDDALENIHYYNNENAEISKEEFEKK